MRFGSLFSGIGGFDLGLERAGMEPAWQVELDEKCQEVLAHHWPTARRYSDVRRVHALAPVDLVCGGFPCQDLSVAGKRAGLAGERSGLWHEFRRVIAEVAPRWVLVENVPGLLSSNSGEDFAVIIEGLVELGYGVAWRVLDAQYFGVPQRRRRVFIVGCLGDWAAPAAVLLEPESVSGASPPRREAREEPAHAVRASTSQRGTDDPDRMTFVPDVSFALASQHRKVGQGHNTTYLPDVAWALQERDAKGPDSDAKDGHLIIAHALSSEGADASEDGTGRGTPLVVAPLGGGNYGQGNSDEGVPNLVMSVREDGRTGAVYEMPYASAVGQAGGKPGQGYQAIREPGASVRRLTPTECERLQGFPDGWTFGSDSTRYRQLGNAVCVPVGAWLGWRLAEVHAALETAA